MPLIEAALRGGALTLLLLIAVLRLREARRSPAGLYAGLFALSVAAYVVESSPDLLTSSAIWLLPLRLVSIGTVAVFWLLATASFDDEFKASWRDAVPWLDRTWRLKRVDDVPVWSISCLYVRKGYRRKGITSALVAAAMKLAERAKAPAVEAYPVDSAVSPSASGH